MKQEQIKKQHRAEDEEVIEDLPATHAKELGEKALKMIEQIDEVTND